MDGLLPPVNVSFMVDLARDLLSPFLDKGIIRARGCLQLRLPATEVCLQVRGRRQLRTCLQLR